MRKWTAVAVAAAVLAACKPEAELPTRPDQPQGGPVAPMGEKHATIKTSKGDIEIVLFGDKAPKAVANATPPVKTATQ